jgi:hypothetical protein
MTKQKELKVEEVDLEETKIDDQNSKPNTQPNNQPITPLNKVSDYRLLEVGKKFEVIVLNIGQPAIFHHERYGDKPYVDILVEVIETKTQETLKLFLPPRTNIIRPNTTTGRLFRQAKVNSLKGLIGKKLTVTANQNGYLRFDVAD